MKKFSLMIFMGFDSSNINHNDLDIHLAPITKVDKIKQITIFKRCIGRNYPKVKYIPTNNKSSLATIIIKFGKGLNYLRQNKVDYIHSFFIIPHAILALILGKLFKKKRGVSLIGTDLDIYIKKRWYGFFLLQLLKSFDVVTVTGSRSKKYLKRKGIDSIILPHCIDTQKFKPNNKIPKEYDLLFVGRLSQEKRLDRIIEVLKHLKNKNESIKLAIVGDGPGEKQLKRAIKNGNLESNVDLLGFQREVIPFYHKSKMLILMSEREGSPLVLPEAMACGVVPVVLDVGDIQDIVNNENGLIFKHCIPLEIADSIRSVLNNQSKYISLRKNSLKIRNTKGIENGLSFWDELLTKVCNND